VWLSLLATAILGTTTSRRVEETEARVEAECELCGADLDEPGLDPQIEAELQILKQGRSSDSATTGRNQGA
jgi:hypothetical protein